MKKVYGWLFILAVKPFICGAGIFWEVETPELLKICSFNIQFLGHFKKKDDKAPASILKDYDIVAVQELIALLTDGTYPDNTTYNADSDSKDFFDEMDALRFNYKLSEEDTCTNPEIHKNTTENEWQVAFYKPDVVECCWN